MERTILAFCLSVAAFVAACTKQQSTAPDMAPGPSAPTTMPTPQDQGNPATTPSPGQAPSTPNPPRNTDETPNPSGSPPKG